MWTRLASLFFATSAKPSNPQECLQCSYCLFGLKSGQCPECGYPIAKTSAEYESRRAKLNGPPRWVISINVLQFSLLIATCVALLTPSFLATDLHKNAWAMFANSMFDGARILAALAALPSILLLVLWKPMREQPSPYVYLLWGIFGNSCLPTMGVA